MTTPRRPSPAADLAERLLGGAVESLARAGAKALESLAADVKRGLKKEAERAETFEQMVKIWRTVRLGQEANDDLPDSLKPNGKEPRE